ncbi:hypothetical protein [Streptomyces sp. NPDC001401]|uniref:hypothetical protein n=1 Tax=Streptomyces sp. NPDC001401 TaxID=3364570 RepID=UPI00367F8EEA
MTLLPRTSLRLAAVLALSLGGFATGCTTPAAGADGPLHGAVDEGAQVCTPKRTGQTLSLGAEVLHNYGSDDVVVDSVVLDDPHGLRLVTALLVPVKDNLFGVDSYPPSSYSLNQPGVQWAQRQRAVGATLTPQGPGATESADAVQSAAPQSAEPTTTPSGSTTPAPTTTKHNLLLAIRVTGKTPDAHLSGVTVKYHVREKKYVWRNLTQLTVETNKDACPPV